MLLNYIALSNTTFILILIGAKSDLDIAIEKSQGLGTAACQAFTQRAMIRRYQGL